MRQTARSPKEVWANARKNLTGQCEISVGLGALSIWIITISIVPLAPPPPDDRRFQARRAPCAPLNRLAARRLLMVTTDSEERGMLGTALGEVRAAMALVVD